MLPIIDRYLLSEVSKAFLAILLVLALVVHSHGFIALLKDVAEGQFNADVLFQMLGLQMLRYLPRLIPPAFFFAILYALGRMYQDSEMIALESCGVGIRRIYRAFLYSALPLALITAWLSLMVQPWSAAEAERIKESQRGEEAELAGISAGQFNEYNRGELVLYVEKLDRDRQMKNLFIHRRLEEGAELITAEKGFHRRNQETGDRYIVLMNGQRYSGMPGQADYVLGRFESYALRLGEDERGPLDLRTAARPTTRLLASSDIHDQAELQRRLSFPLAVLVFALVSIPLSRSLPRQGMYGRLFFAFLVYFVFLNLHGVSKRWMEDALTPAWIGTWWVHGLMLLLSLLLLSFNTVRFRRWRRRWRERRVMAGA
ncbi:MAG TPA: LPS export ABC transporter permease LptF [Chromatiales bacterium]|nr:LPS export ABC transporter permease LptF [Chromatiales bacterium]